MNIWSINKHKYIKLLLFHLEFHLGHNSFYIDPRDDKDYNSVMLFKSDKQEVRAYIYLHGQTQDKYGIHLEYPVYMENNLRDSIRLYDDLSRQQIVDTLSAHFEAANHEVAV